MTKQNKIFVIEDNHEMRENIVEILELANYEVQSAKDGKEGIQGIRVFVPDLILCDVMMPNLDGFGVLSIIQQDDFLKNIPFIFLTAKAEKDDIRKGMNLGAEDYLIKPFDDTDLLQVIERRINKYKNLGNELKKEFQNNLFSITPFVTNKEILELVKNEKLTEVAKKSKLWKIGSVANQIIYLEKGLVKEYIDAPDGKIFIINFYKGPCFVGLQNLFQTHFKSTLEVLDETSSKYISKKLVEETILKQHLLPSVLYYTAELSKEYLSRLSMNSFGNVREKVAFHLLLLDSKLMHETSKINREDFASFCGIAKETLIRTLTEFKEDHLIKISPNGIVITQKQKLESIIF